MPILQPFTLPSTPSSLRTPSSEEPLFLAFLASKDPKTNQPWCPDVRAVLPKLEATFQGGKKPTVAFIEVGQRTEWKDPKNVFRTKWNVNNVPTLVRYEKVTGSDEVKETGRLIEGEILDESKLAALLGVNGI